MHITIYTKSNCGFCIKAKQLMETHGIKYTEVDITHDKEAHRNLLAECAKINVFPKSVPQVWRNEEYLGGFAELQKSIYEFTKTNSMSARYR
jgi:glutaredoxin 3